MKKGDKKRGNQSEQHDLAVVTAVDTMPRAKDLEELLISNSIPAVVKDEDFDNPILLMVPEDLVAEAREILKSEVDLEEFYGYAAHLQDDYIEADLDSFDEYL